MWLTKRLRFAASEHHITESVNANSVNVVIGDQVFKRFFHLRRPFKPDPLQVVNDDLRHSGVMRLPCGYPADKHQNQLPDINVLIFNALS